MLQMHYKNLHLQFDIYSHSNIQVQQILSPCFLPQPERVNIIDEYSRNKGLQQENTNFII